MTPEEQKAYRRGYYCGQRWPDHMPPFPPEPVIAGLMKALQELRDECDSLLAEIDEDDPLVKRLDPKVEAADAAMRAVADWLLTRL
jgi:hypothetical protein